MRCSPQPNKSDAAPPHPVFPPEGSAEFERFLSMARDGRIVFGTNSAGEEAIWDLRWEPHALIAGATGSGKSAAATLPVFAALCCPDVFDLIVIDRTGDLAWTAQFPNARHVTDLGEASDCIEQLREELGRRIDLNNRRGEPNLELLRVMYTRNSELAAQDGPAPKRILLVLNDFDERSLPDCAQADLLRIAQLSRAVEINFLVTAQRPTGGCISTHLRAQLTFRLCFGNVDPATSIALLGDERAAVRSSMYDPLARGHAWMNSYRAPRDPVIHVPYLPMQTRQSPWDSSIQLEGAEQRALRRQPVRGDDGAPS